MWLLWAPNGATKERARSSTPWRSTSTSWPVTREGANAGHTVYVNGKKFILQLLPTGIVRPDKTAAIGNGVVVDPEALLREIKAVEGNGVRVDGRLLISDRAHLILPYHRAHEVAAEEARGVGKIGTTAKGIGPAYEDKAGRRGLRAGDLRDPELFRRRCSEIVAEKNRIASALFGGAALDPAVLADQCLEVAQHIVPYLAGRLRLSEWRDGPWKASALRRCARNASGPGPRHLSFRDFLQRFGGRRLHRHRRGADAYPVCDWGFKSLCHARGERPIPKRGQGVRGLKRFENAEGSMALSPGGRAAAAGLMCRRPAIARV